MVLAVTVMVPCWCTSMLTFTPALLPENPPEMSQVTVPALLEMVPLSVSVNPESVCTQLVNLTVSPLTTVQSLVNAELTMFLVEAGVGVAMPVGAAPSTAEASWSTNATTDAPLVPSGAALNAAASDREPCAAVAADCSVVLGACGAP